MESHVTESFLMRFAWKPIVKKRDKIGIRLIYSHWQIIKQLTEKLVDRKMIR
jgi:hypothetical protein